MKRHKSVTIDRVIEAVERRMTSLDNPGICIACGVEAYDCEPDTRRRKCDSCGEPAVYGADELLIMMMP